MSAADFLQESTLCEQVFVFRIVVERKEVPLELEVLGEAFVPA